MKTYTVKMSRSVVEYREILFNCENEEELIELLDEKLEKHGAKVIRRSMNIRTMR